MGSLLSSLGAGLVLVISLLITYSYIQDKRRNPAGLPYPPGPKGYPIIGNLFDLPSVFIYKHFRELSRELSALPHLFSPRPSTLIDPRVQILTSFICKSLVSTLSRATAKVLQMIYSISARLSIRTGRVASALS
jgi:hypothetical protein